MSASLIGIALSAATPSITTAEPAGTVGNVSSQGSPNSITVGIARDINQTILPTLVRGPLLVKFKERFSTGAALFRKLRAVTNEDDAVLTCTEIDGWLNDTSSWLRSQVGDYAVERFLFVNSRLATYGASGWSPENLVKYSDYFHYMHTALSNLDQLMREPSLYSEK